MAPSAIEFEKRSGAPDVLSIDPGEKVDKINHLRPVNIVVGCNENDEGGFLLIEGQIAAISVKKHSSEHDSKGTAIAADSEITFKGPAFIRISSPFYDEALKVYHRKSTARRFIGNIPPGYQSA